jgi:hypothetical protein
VFATCFYGRTHLINSVEDSHDRDLLIFCCPSIGTGAAHLTSHRAWMFSVFPPAPLYIGPLRPPPDDQDGWQDAEEGLAYRERGNEPGKRCL